MNFISRIIKSINAMRERLKIERHEAMYGPHFNEIILGNAHNVRSPLRGSLTV
nr:MAG TPA: hypothetical protein [Caudoviricetes sp.]